MSLHIFLCTSLTLLFIYFPSIFFLSVTCPRCSSRHVYTLLFLDNLLFIISPTHFFINYKGSTLILILQDLYYLPVSTAFYFFLTHLHITHLNFMFCSIFILPEFIHSSPHTLFYSILISLFYVNLLSSLQLQTSFPNTRPCLPYFNNQYPPPRNPLLTYIRAFQHSIFIFIFTGNHL